MALRGILRLGLIQLKVLDLDQSIAFYTDRMGLQYLGKTEDGRAMFKAYDEFDHHSVVLRESVEPGLDFLAYKAYDRETVDEVVRASEEDYELPIKKLPEGSQPGFGDIYLIRIPTGHAVGVYNEVELSDLAPEIANPNIWREEPRGVAPRALDHCLLYGPNQPVAVDWFINVMGMSKAEVVYADHDGNELCTWLTGNNRAHDVAVLNFPEPNKIHHLGFNLPNWAAVGHAADIMGRYNIPIDRGPTKHGVTRGETIYFFDPSGNRLETFSGGYEYFPDNPMRYWDPEQTGTGIFYYDKSLNDRFLGAYT